MHYTTILFVIPIGTLIVAAALAFWISQQSAGDEKTKKVGDAIAKGARAFLAKEYQILSIFIVIIFVLLGVFLQWMLSFAFLFGALLSIAAGNIGMRVATSANSRTATAAKLSMKSALSIAFTSGWVIGLTVVSLGLLGIVISLMIFKDPSIIFGFGFGASFVALFARVGGGIYAKAADVGADLVGKVEAGIPEDDPRNPATIADTVGDNVGDVAGMGADLFESYVQSIIAAMALGVAVTFGAGIGGLWLPLALAGAGIVASLLGGLLVRLGNFSPERHLNHGIWGATILAVLFALYVVRAFEAPIGILYAFVTGLIAGVLTGIITEFYTSYAFKPTQNVSASSRTGAATTIISGMALGMLSTFWPIIVIAAALFLSFLFGGVFGIAIAAVGMLSTLGITLAADTYGPVADNAAGIAEMARLGTEVRERTETLDAVGNTTAAIGKGFAIGSAGLTALVLMVSYTRAAGLSVIDVLEPKTIVGLFVGATIPFVFSALTMASVGKAAQKMVDEVRRQFREIAGLMDGHAEPDYKTAVTISTHAALKEMIAPGLLALVTPIVVGFSLGSLALGGFLMGSIITGLLLAIFMANAGGIWDNAKKYIEAGNFGGKGSQSHKAAVVGDTVGDPLKDTSGPSLNILLKLMSIVALLIAALL